MAGDVDWAREVLELALRLTLEQRVMVAQALVDGIVEGRSVEDDDEPLSPEWRAEIERRLWDLDEGRTSAVPAEEVIEQLRRRRDALAAQSARAIETARRERERTHERLLAMVERLPTDFVPYGARERTGDAFDCSAGCRWFLPLKGRLGHDWGVCGNPESPRAGLLTFEHQGCPMFAAHDDP